MNVERAFSYYENAFGVLAGCGEVCEIVFLVEVLFRHCCMWTKELK